mmetsp:Transcript_22088/g.61391  ORF Transcript_22088/g.61391 Transcript_22088/m.61391 type:complete len:201 (+) Transcript_22088:1238-1840(+)
MAVLVALIHVDVAGWMTQWCLAHVLDIGFHERVRTTQESTLDRCCGCFVRANVQNESGCAPLDWRCVIWMLWILLVGYRCVVNGVVWNIGIFKPLLRHSVCSIPVIISQNQKGNGSNQEEEKAKAATAIATASPFLALGQRLLIVVVLFVVLKSLLFNLRGQQGAAVVLFSFFLVHVGRIWACHGGFFILGQSLVLGGRS